MTSALDTHPARPTWRPVLVAWGVALVAIGALGWLVDAVREHEGITRRDSGVLDFFVDERSGVLVQVARWVTDLASPAVLLAAAVGVGWLLWRRGAPIVWALVPMGSLALAAVVTFVGKHELVRSRPPASLRLVTETEPSFPSGHTGDGTALLLAVALVVVLLFVRRRDLRALVVGATVAGCVAIGLSRLELGVHWPTDVIAGWAVGVAVVGAVAGGALLVAGLDPTRVGRGPVPAVVRALQHRRREPSDLR